MPVCLAVCRVDTYLIQLVPDMTRPFKLHGGFLAVMNLGIYCILFQVRLLVEVVVEDVGFLGDFHC